MLSDHLRPNAEAAPWVIAEVKKLEQELADAYLEMQKIQPAASTTQSGEEWSGRVVSGSECPVW